ncbi:cupin domain-containing protein [Robiginitalea sp. IMCC44478]|uniref:cupin domain-containing protein n=1 Tax=Robiginitalea sp. IMCC44478 TaxID=3459122 RepID=UPI0040412E8B
MKTKSKTTRQFLMLAAACLLFFSGSNSLKAQEENIQKMLESFVESYKTDPMALSGTFGVKVNDQWWHVTTLRKQEGYKVGKKKQYTFHNFGPHDVSLHKGKPTIPTWYFEFANLEVLENVYSGYWSASTAAAKSTAEDKVGLNIRPTEGHEFSAKDEGISYQVMEHFWKKDAVEITRFTRDQSLPSHGAALVSLYTMKDKRIAWFSLGKDEAANTEKNLDKGQVPNLLIFTKGKGKGLFGEEEVDIEPGMSVFIGPYVKHVIYNPYDQPLEGLVVLFGDNPDFVWGQSYIDFMDKQYEFLGANHKEVHQQKNAEGTK